MALKNLFAYRLIRFLRWVLPVFVLVLIVIVARNYWVRRHQPGVQSSQLQRFPAELAALTQGVTYERFDGSRKVFTIHAKSDEDYKDNKGMLDDVDVTIYADTPGKPPRRVTSKQCTYDQGSNDIHFFGNVQVQLDPRTTAYTEDMVYNQGNGQIASDTRSRLERREPGAMTGEADRMEYNSKSGLLKLWGNVQVRGDNDVALDAGSAVFQDKENWATVADGIYLRSKNGVVRGQTGRADLTPQTYKPRVVVVEGNATAESAPAVAAADAWKMRAPWMQAYISDGHADKIFARNQVEAEKGSGDSKRTLTGQEVDANLGASGKVEHLEARTGAQLLGSNQTLSSNKIQINSSERIETEGPSILETQERLITGSRFIMQQGDTEMKFETPNRSTMKSKAGGSESIADHAAATFDSHTNSLISLNQDGNFQFTDAEAGRRGHAQKATVTENGDRVTLEGSPVVTDSQMQLQAGTIELNEKTNEFAAHRSVQTLTIGDDGQQALVLANEAHGNAGKVFYDGAVELRRSPAYIQAAHLTVTQHDDQSELHAEGVVTSRMGMVTASADKLDYNQTAQTAHYTGNVHSRKQDMATTSADMLVKMVDNQVSETLSSGKVTLTSADSHGAGDHAVYDAKTNVVTLTGPKAQMTDPQRGHAQGSRIVMTLFPNGTLDKMRVESSSTEPALSQQKVKKE